MAVDRDNGREIPYFEFPDRLGTPEPFEADAENTLDAPGVDLRGAAPPMRCYKRPLRQARRFGNGSRPPTPRRGVATVAWYDSGARFRRPFGRWELPL